MGKTTLLDIAKYANVSKTTVSMVLNNKPISVSDETRENILKAAKELNYIPNSLARSLSTKKTYTIGVIVPDIQNPFFSEMAKHIEITAERYGYSVILCNSFNSYEREENYIRLLISKLVDGVIFAASGDKPSNVNTLIDNKIPFTVVDRLLDTDKKYNGVFCENKYGIYLGVEYLYKKNKRKIAFVGGDDNSSVVKIRLNSFREIAKKLGILDEDIIIKESFTLNGGINSTKEIIKRNKNVEAIFYSSDIMAIGGIKYLLREGYLIPDDISILGYDNIDIGSFIEPELTTIAQPISEMGKEACNLLIKLINEKSNGEIINIKPYLIERSTVT